MENVSQPKVFEFAKEIGMETLTLMDKIREWKLPVRSHMAELDADMLEQIKTKLKDDTGKKPEAAKKKKAPAAKKAAGEEAAPPKAKASAAKAASAKAAPPKAEAPANKKVTTKKPAD